MPQDTRDDNIDAIITSPPYESGFSSSKHRGGIIEREKGKEETMLKIGEGVKYSDSENNIGNLASSDKEFEALDETIKRLRRYGRMDPKAGGPYGRSLGHPYSPNRDNIGNLKSSEEEYGALAKGLMINNKPTYLSEMLKVYREFYKVLKPNGLAIIIIKPFVRNKRIIDLPYHTYILLKACGFVLEKLYKLRLKAQSFWRILYSKKFPDVPLINHEYILVMRKND